MRVELAAYIRILRNRSIIVLNRLANFRNDFTFVKTPVTRGNIVMRSLRTRAEVVKGVSSILNYWEARNSKE